MFNIMSSNLSTFNFNSFLISYQPKSSPLNLSILSDVVEYRDYKFSNGFWYLEPEELNKFVSKMSLERFQLLLDQLFSVDPELYNLFKKILKKESSEDDYRNYILFLEKTDLMKYNYSRLYNH
jgi:hypothetical protein